jgi:peptide/nickel transport system substrate-binding protein
VNRIRRGHKVLALAAAATMVIAACGSDDDSSSSDTTADSTADSTAGTEAPAGTDAPTDTEAPTDTTEGTTAEGEEPAGEAAFTITYELSDNAVWNDGTPITAADFQCTVDATVNTPGSLSTTGYDDIISVEEGASPTEVIVTMDVVYAPWKTLFGSPGLLKADEFEDCNDVSTDFEGGITFSGREWLLDSWSAEQLVYTPNPGYTGEKVPQAERIVIVPAEDGTTLLKAGDVDFIFPQAYTGIDAELADPNVAYDSAPGGSYEALYFQQSEEIGGPFSDDDYRQAFSKSIDLQGLYDQIYAPFAQGLPLLTCGPIAPGPYCDETAFTDTYDPAAAETILTDAGWTKNDAGMWTNPDGEVPQVRWMVNTGNTRRESAQAYLIPLLAQAGFDVVADNCEALPCVFETRIPSLDYDLAMYISTVAPDPTYLTQTNLCDQIPSESNDFQGQNTGGWCNEEADAALRAADAELDEDTRIEEVQKAISLMAEDAVLLPTLQFPNIGAYRTDKLANSQAELANYRAINDWYQWEDVDGDGTIVIGAEQFPAPDCPNPITECANSSWFVWTTAFQVLPAPFDSTSEQTFEISEMLAGEPVAEAL